MSDLTRLARYLLRRKALLGAALASMAVLSACTGATIWMVRFIWDDLISPTAGTAGGGLSFIGLLAQAGLPTFQGSDAALLTIVAALAAIYFCKAVAVYLSTYLVSVASLHAVNDVRNDLYARLHTQDLAFFQQHRTGGLMSRLLSDTGKLQAALAENLIRICRQGFTVLVLMGLMIYYDWKLAGLALFAAPLIFALVYRLGKRLKRYARRSQEERENLSHTLKETLASIRIVKVFQMEDYEKGRFRRLADRLRRLSQRIARITALTTPLMEITAGTAAVLLIWYGHSLTRSGGMSPGVFTSFLVAMVATYRPMKELGRSYNKLQQGLAAAERVFALMDAAPAITDRPGAAALNGVGGDIAFHDVSFAYAGREESALQGVSVRIAPGQRVALVGPNGAGKSTFVHLLPRLYDPTAGAVTIGGRDLREFTVDSLRRQVGMVTQDIYLFSGTVEENVRYGHWSASRDQVIAAARATHADAFIRELPRGYDERIGEGGQWLSGGQRQLLSIARSLLKDPSILILDEATSELDARTEAALQEGLRTLLEGRTAFIIAHRLATVLHADRILVLDRGRIIADGPHADLLQTCPLYRELYRLQFRTDAKLDPAN